jgi:hypothetical protein
MMFETRINREQLNKSLANVVNGIEKCVWEKNGWKALQRKVAGSCYVKRGTQWSKNHGPLRGPMRREQQQRRRGRQP